MPNPNTGELRAFQYRYTHNNSDTYACVLNRKNHNDTQIMRFKPLFQI
jgi:hypothetical protein